MSKVDLRKGTVKHQGWIQALPSMHTCVTGIDTTNGGTNGGTTNGGTTNGGTNTDLVDGDGESLPPDGLLITALEGWGSGGDDAT